MLRAKRRDGLAVASSAALSTGMAAFPALTMPASAWACATCGGTLSSDAAMGYSATAGWRINLEYDYINQDELRSGTSAVASVPDGNEL